MILALVGGLLALLAVIYFSMMIGAKNGAVEHEEKLKAAWGDVEVQLQRRMDLIPSLVETVKGAAQFERDTLEAVVQARAAAHQAKISLGSNGLPPEGEAMQRYMSAQNSLGGALSRLLVVAEKYPELKATQSFQDLQNQLEGTENRIAQSRRSYNDAVRVFNTHVRKFPNSMFLSQEEFPVRSSFEAPVEAMEVPKVDFSSKPASND
ncbi:MAG: LemA family protein [Planctomycetota bacterium]|nr:MAG: LemA family protein [Planctomycetota bacterium]